MLKAASVCLNQLWATASSDRGLPWVSPKIVVYTHPDVPADATCGSQFSADAPRMCNLDSTIYWPIGFGTASDLTDPVNVPGTYLWDLAFVYTNTAYWNSSLTVYYGTIRTELETTDPERFEETWRRLTLQRLCLASSASMQFPTSTEPSPAVREMLTDPSYLTGGGASAEHHSRIPVSMDRPRVHLQWRYLCLQYVGGRPRTGDLTVASTGAPMAWRSRSGGTARAVRAHRAACTDILPGAMT